jgi:hypothetical protein
MAQFYRTTSATINTNQRLLYLSGTVTTTVDSTTVTGLGTTFTTQLRVGDKITLNTTGAIFETQVVISITSDTVLITEKAFINAGASLVAILTPKSKPILFQIRADETNSAPILFGESYQNNGINSTGTDVTNTTRVTKLTPGQTSSPIPFERIENVFTRSGAINQIYTVISGI